MDIKQAKEAKWQLADSIRAQIEAFERATGMKVDGVELGRVEYQTVGGGVIHAGFVQVEVRVQL